MKVNFRVIIAVLLAITVNPNLVTAASKQDVYLKPFILAQYVTAVDLDSYSKKIRKNLVNGGFQVVGEYSPYPKSKIYAVTHSQLKKIAAKTPYGGFGAVLKVSLIKTDKGIQLSYNNPAYIGLAYNMGSQLESIQSALKKSIGFKQEFGGGIGIKTEDLPSYNYTMGLEGFDGFMELAEFRSFEQAKRKVQRGLVQGKYGIKQVYRVDIPGKKQVIFGMSMNADVKKQPFLNDEYVMGIIDHKTLKRLPHLPYEIMVNGNKVIAMHPHFRLAVNFPEMRMFGANSFGKLLDLPFAYEEYFIKTVGGQWPPPNQDW